MSAPLPPLRQAAGLEFRARHAQGDFTLDAAFEARGLGVTALFGPSGAGKTTIVQAIAGLIRPHKGRIVVNGETLYDSEAGVHVPPKRRGVGYVFQDARLFPHLSVRSNLLYGAKRARGRKPAIGFEEAVELLGLSHLLGRRPNALSGGEKRRVALGRALLAAPKLLLLDEPLAGLDRARREEILPFLADLRDQARVPMVYVTHAAGEVARLADTVVTVEQGQALAAAPTLEALERLNLEPGYKDRPSATVEAVVAEHLPAEGTSLLRFAGGRLRVPLLAQAVGAKVKVRVQVQSDRGAAPSADG